MGALVECPDGVGAGAVVAASRISCSRFLFFFCEWDEGMSHAMDRGEIFFKLKTGTHPFLFEFFLFVVLAEE